MFGKVSNANKYKIRSERSIFEKKYLWKRMNFEFSEKKMKFFELLLSKTLFQKQKFKTIEIKNV